jgi:hypothetical protein
MKQLLVVFFLAIAIPLSAQNAGTTKKDIVKVLKENLDIPEGLAAGYSVKDLDVSGTIMKVKLVHTEKDLTGGMQISNCYSFDLAKIEYAAEVSNMDILLLKAINDDTSIYKVQKCTSVDTKKGTDKLPLTVFYELYFMLPAKNKEETVELFNQLVAICHSESKKN